jgi:hypothetical protein
MISTNSHTSTEGAESDAIASYLRATPSTPLLPPVDHLATPAGRVAVEQAMAGKLADLVIAHGAVTKVELLQLFTCREVKACFPGALRRVPSHVRELAIAA